MFLALAGCDNGTGGGNGDATDPAVTWPSGLTVQKGEKLSSVALDTFTNNPPGKFTWAKPATTINASGKHSMKFTPEDVEAYNTVTGDVTVTVVLKEMEMEMVRVVGGTFKMGSKNSTYYVKLSSFYIGKYEVTQEQYEAVMGENPSQFQSDADPGEVQERRPVERVNWFDAVRFCNKLSISEGLTPAYMGLNSTNPDDWGEPPTTAEDDNLGAWNAIYVVAGANGYRLPTEAQWEYACRNGTDKNYNASTDDLNDNIGWYGGQNTHNSGLKTHEVGLKASNVSGILGLGLGLFDMHGNVAEWCWDWYGAYPTTTTETAPAIDPTGVTTPQFTSQRIMRGGSALAGSATSTSYYRSQANSFGRSNGYGLRVVRPAQ